MSQKKKKVAILTGGGDCPGLNAVIRAITKKLILGYDIEVLGIEDGYEGLVQNRWHRLSYNDVSGILTLGGTILGTSNVANPYRYAIKKNGRVFFRDFSRKTLRNIRRMGIDALVCIGGDGTLNTAYRLFQDGVSVIGVPKTIDNDIKETDITFGFDTAVAIATEGIDRIHTTAQSHHRIMIVELMGRKAGWIALYAGVAGGGDIILIPEIKYSLQSVAKKVEERNRKGKKFSIIVVAEGARARGKDFTVQRIVKESPDALRFGGVGFSLGASLEHMTDIETRTVVMGHLQRGGTPTAFDRILATQLGAEAAEMVAQGKFGKMVAVRNGEFVHVPLEHVAGGFKEVPPDNKVFLSAREVGICFGD